MPIFLYIDPGTGTMLFSVFMGVASVLFFAARGIILKLRFIVSGGRQTVASTNRIPIVIFAESKRYWNVFKPVCDEIEKRGIMCEYWTTSKDDPSFEENYMYITPRFLGEGNSAYAKLNLMNAEVCLSTTPGLDVYQWKRSKNCDMYIHVFHSVGEAVLYRMFGLDYYDAILATGTVEEGYIRRIEELRGIKKKEIQIVGLTYFDTLVERKRAEDTKREVNADAQKCENKKVLLAPSWGDNSLTNRYGERLIDALINTGYDVIYRPHPQSFIADRELMDRLEKKYMDSERFYWDMNSDNFDSLYKSDILISDFSGIIFDYAFCFDKPVIYTNEGFDSSAYDAWWLENDSWTLKNIKNVGKELKQEEFDSIKECIDELISSDSVKEKRETMKQIAWRNQGRAAIAITDYMEKRIQ